MNFVETSGYQEKVYAGVLGKVIGVTSGKPIEGWASGRIRAELGEIHGYVHERLGYPLICTDDDISGTFTFLRSIEDSGYSLDLTPNQIARSWLNYLIEGRSVLWWGGIGSSAEHTAYLRLKSGIKAPESGSAKLNGKRLSEQIGAQIFIDGWAMVYPGERDRAVEMARRAASVSHDGEAIEGAAALAAMESMAFVNSDIGQLVEEALAVVDPNSVIASVIRDVRTWSSRPNNCYQQTLEQIEETYGARAYGVGHIIPNHALIHLALWHGEGDFTRSLDIVNACGWDTDCNAGNLGCLLGIRNGIDGIPPEWRDPIADRVYLPTADTGRAVSDCLTEALAVINMARLPRGIEALRPKEGAKHSFFLPGAVQGYRSKEARLANARGGLEIEFSGHETRVMSPVFIPPNLEDMHGYDLLVSPRVYPGQWIEASVVGRSGIRAAIALGYYDENDDPTFWFGPEVELDATPTLLSATVPRLGAQPIYEIGLRLAGDRPGKVLLNWLDWGGIPECLLLEGTLGLMGKSMWVPACDDLQWRAGEGSTILTIIHNHGCGMALLGCREWQDYRVRAVLNPRCGGRFGLAFRMRGLQHYGALLLDTSGTVELGYQDEGWTRLAAAEAKMDIDSPIEVSIDVCRERAVVRAGSEQIQAECQVLPTSGAIAVVAEQIQLEVLSLSLSPSEQIK